MRSTRPALHVGLSADVFLDHYWLKEELVAFCRAQGVSAAGAKADLTAQVVALLNGGTSPDAKTKRPRVDMPALFTLATVVGPGWRCSQELRAFFSVQLGRTFRFDRFMREQIGGAAAGRTLAEVIQAWKANVETSAQTEIEPQFEYNRFMRAFRALQPDATHQEVVKAWRTYRSLPASERPPVEELARRNSS